MSPRSGGFGHGRRELYIVSPELSGESLIVGPFGEAVAFGLPETADSVLSAQTGVFSSIFGGGDGLSSRH
jgi:hypothetical protein